MEIKTLKGIFIGLFFGILVVVFGFFIFNKKPVLLNSTVVKKEIIDEESVVTKVVEQATPSVVTVSIVKPKVNMDIFGVVKQTGTSSEQQDIGSGFIIGKEGLIVTNKHVVSDTAAKYKVIIGKDEMLEVNQIYRDPVNDLAILKVNRTNLVPVNMGDSDKIKVGGTVIAIGTALGQFRSTVTTGVISGVGRGIITAGDSVSGSEKLDNVIQTDAAINPGNSGGPLFNSNGEVIGVNVATSQSGQNIGFALPINLVKESIENFKTTGEFERPYLGVGYREISKQTALLNDVPAGGYVSELISGSPAEKAGVQKGDIITEVDGKKLIDTTSTSLVTIINKKKIGDTIEIKVWRSGKEMIFRVMLEKRPV